MGAGRRAHAEQRVQGRQCPHRARAISRSGRAAAPGGPPDIGSRHPQHRLRRPQRGTTAASTARASAAGARQNRRPTHMPGAGVVYVNDPDQFSVELLWMSPASDRRWGFAPRAPGEAARADTHAVERTVRIAAPAQATWDAIASTSRWARWLGLGSVRRAVCGAPEPDGRGSERLLKLPGAKRHRAGAGVRTTHHVSIPGDEGFSVRLPSGRDHGCGKRVIRPSSRGGSASGRKCREPAAPWRPCSPGCSDACLR